MPLAQNFLSQPTQNMGLFVVARCGIRIAMVLIPIQTEGPEIANSLGQAANIMPVIRAGLPISTKGLEVVITKAKLPAHAER